MEPAREALITKSVQFAGRPNDSYSNKLLFRDNKDLIIADYGQFWKLMRKLSHSALKMYGDGMGNIEAKVINESEELHARLRGNTGKPTDVQHELGMCILLYILTWILYLFENI